MSTGREGVHSFEPNRQKGPQHWKGWEALIQPLFGSDLLKKHFEEKPEL